MFRIILIKFEEIGRCYCAYIFLKSKLINRPRFVQSMSYFGKVCIALTFLFFKVSRPKFQKFFIYRCYCDFRGLFGKFGLKVVCIYPQISPTNQKMTNFDTFWSKTWIFVGILRLGGRFLMKITSDNPFAGVLALSTH